MYTGGGFKNVLVIGADSLSRYVDWTDRGTCILFGDAAGAVVVQVISPLRVFFFWSSINVCSCFDTKENYNTGLQ